MALFHRDADQQRLTQDARNAPGQLTSAPGGLTSGDELLAETDEPPDEPQERTPRPAHAHIHTSQFQKTAPPQFQRKQSLLTQMIHSETESLDEEDHHPDPVRRGMSTVSISTTSTAELTSDDALTSPGTRTSTPSPPLPPVMFRGLSSIFDKAPSHTEPVIHQEEHTNVGPTQKLLVIAPSEQTVEEGLGRKRCISFACGRKDTSKDTPKVNNQQDPPKTVDEKPVDQPKRPCALKFVCPTRTTADTSLKENKPKTHRLASPAPVARMRSPPPKPTPRNHRDSDSTIRNSSPKAVRKVPSVIRSRRYSENSDVDRSEATRFHEFASSEEEVDDWTQEQTCHRSRLTVNDTLKVENGLRQLVEEVEEEVLEDEEEELDEDDVNDDDDEDLVDEEDEEGLEADVASTSDVSDEGFQTDDEDGFANSDDESDADSDYHWWAPRRATAPASADRFDHVRPTSRRSVSESSNGSVRSGHLPAPVVRSPEMRTKKKPPPVIVGTPELPDSTDFVCGTLDEDRPLEYAYLSRREQQRASKHKLTPQDIDPTFPTSDPEMDEEDEDSEHDDVADSDHHPFMHGQPDPHEDHEVRGRRGSKKHSPKGSPKRLRSPPPPIKRGIHRSPPPHKLFGQSPKRHRSPPPAARWRSPPPTRRTSFTRSPTGHTTGNAPAVLAARPQTTIASSLPRAMRMPHPGTVAAVHEETDDDAAPSKDLRTRGAVDIVKGLEKKRQRRKEMLYQKHCRKAAAGREREQRRPPPGRGAERMREVGMELAAYRGARRPAGGVATAAGGANATATTYNGDLHMLSI